MDDIRRRITDFEEFEEQSGLLVLAEISRSRVAVVAVQYDVDVVDWVEVVGVARLHLHHVPHRPPHFTTEQNRTLGADYSEKR